MLNTVVDLAVVAYNESCKTTVNLAALSSRGTVTVTAAFRMEIGKCT